jgi:transcription elongation factor GreA
MRTPTRKPGKYFQAKTDPRITPEKYLELEKKLDRLKKFSQPEAIKEVKRLASDGDFSENAAYQIAKGRLRGINQRIIEIGNQLKRAEIISPKSQDRVEIGHRVTIEVEGREKIFLILGSQETDPQNGVISHASPIGAGLLGLRPGETATVIIRGKPTNIKVKKIE